MNNLHLGGRWLYRIRSYSTLFTFGIFVSVYVIFFINSFLGDSIGMALIITIGLYLLFVVVIAEIYARMSYNRWFYDKY